MKHLMEAQEEDEKKIERDREFFFFFELGAYLELSRTSMREIFHKNS